MELSARFHIHSLHFGAEIKEERYREQDVIGAGVDIQEAIAYELSKLCVKPADVPVYFSVECIEIFGKPIHDSAQRYAFEELALGGIY